MLIMCLGLVIGNIYAAEEDNDDDSSSSESNSKYKSWEGNKFSSGKSIQTCIIK